MAFYLAFKEVWRSRGRFFLFSLVIALITALVLFTAALSEGLALANKEYLSKLNAELIAFQKTSDRSAAASRIGRSQLNDIRRVEGVEEIGAVGFGKATIIEPMPLMSTKPRDVSLVGVEPGKPGAAPALEGENLFSETGQDAVIDGKIAAELGLGVGDKFAIRVTRGNDQDYYTLRVAGVTDGRQYLFQPSIFIPYREWDKISPQGTANSPLVELNANIVTIKVKDPQNWQAVANRIMESVDNVEVVDIKTAIESIPGYSAQQGTLSTQQFFTLFIGVLVIGGFFQIQMLQKVPLIGVLKAIGTPNQVVAAAVVLQIIIVTTFGVAVGSLVTGALALALPAGIPVVFNGPSVAVAIAALLGIGPAGGLVSVRLAVTIEPLKALGLSA